MKERGVNLRVALDLSFVYSRALINVQRLSETKT